MGKIVFFARFYLKIAFITCYEAVFNTTNSPIFTAFIPMAKRLFSPIFFIISDMPSMLSYKIRQMTPLFCPTIVFIKKNDQTINIGNKIVIFALKYSFIKTCPAAKPGIIIP